MESDDECVGLSAVDPDESIVGTDGRSSTDDHRDSSDDGSSSTSTREDQVDSLEDGHATDEDGHSIEETDESRILDATLWPFRRRSEPSSDLVITIYVVTGRHGILTISEDFCRECNLFTRAADVAAERVDAAVSVRVVSWWTHVPWALRHGGYHAPVMVVGSNRLCQGYDVPTPEDVVAAIEVALDE